MKVSIYRYNPETDDVPYLQDYDFNAPGERDLMVLDLLELLKENPRSAISQIQRVLLKKET